MFGGLARVLAAISTKSVDVYEWAQADIRKSRLANGPVWDELTKPHPKLQFSGWKLAHAVVKADYLIERDLLLPGLGFLLQLDRIVDFGAGPNLKLVPGGTVTLNDFTRFSLSGRIGQGLSLLFAQEKGYKFVCHLASDPIVAAHIASLPGKSKKAADFLFEGTGSQRMILESKSSFSQAANDPTPIKSTLKAGLTKQVDYWMSRITPAASKGFAIYSCLRESDNPVPSALMFVDPPEQKLREPIEFPDGRIRRRNYAAWMKLMGLNEAAQNLIEPGRRLRRQIDLPIIQIGSQRFAVSVQLSPHNLGRWVCAGLDVHVIKAISAALDDNDKALLAYDGLTTDGLFLTADGLEFGSVFPDGSYLGWFDEHAAFLGFEQFTL